MVLNILISARLIIVDDVYSDILFVANTPQQGTWGTIASWQFSDMLSMGHHCRKEDNLLVKQTATQSSHKQQWQQQYLLTTMVTSRMFWSSLFRRVWLAVPHIQYNANGSDTKGLSTYRHLKPYHFEALHNHTQCQRISPATHQLLVQTYYQSTK